MLLQHGAGPSGTSSPKLPGAPKLPASPVPGTSSPCGDGAGASPRLGASGSPRLAPGASGSPRPGGSPRAGRPSGALEEEAALERLQTEMKEGWTVHTGRDGRLYYCNHVTRTAGWLPPAECWAGGADEGGAELPYGWERAADCRVQPYYINHANKTTTYVAPDGGGRADAPPEPRDVTLERDAELGFGFVAGSERPVVVRFVTDNSPSVGKLEPGDEILCVNGEDVRAAAREHVIAAVRACEARVTLRVCQPARAAPPGRRSALLSAAKRARLRARPPRVRFADSVQVNGAPLFPPSAFSLGDLCLPPMANVLKVFLENGQTKSFKYDASTTVQDVFGSLRDKLCLAAPEHFSLVVEHVKSLRRNKLTLLDPREPLARIAARPGAHKMRCLFRVAFAPASAAALAQRDLAALDYLYAQCCNDVAQERFAPELQPDVALRLAALHMHQHAMANNVPAAKLTVKVVEKEFGLERFVPSGLLENMKRKELRRLLSHFLKLNSQMTGNQQKQLTQLQAKLHYLDIISSLPSYGAKCFSSNQPERVLLVSPKFGLSQIIGIRNSVPQPIANLEELEAVRLTREDELSSTVSVFLQRDRVLSFSMDERDATEMALVLAGYYRLATGQELSVDQEREPITEDIAPPYLSQHNVVPAKWSYLNYDHPLVQSKKHYAIFNMPPPYHSTPGQNKNLDTNMNSSIANRNHSATSSPLLGYDSARPGILGHDVHFDKCKRSEEFRLFDSDDMLYFDDGMGFDLHSILSMELLENASNNPKLVEARNEEVLRRVAEMQKLVENSEQYLTEQGELVYRGIEEYEDGIYDGAKETSVDQLESDNESNNSRMSLSDDAPGVLKHSDSLILLTETINQGLSGLGSTLTGEVKEKKSDLNRRQSQGLSAILNNCGLTDAILALNNDLSQSESDNDSNYTPTSSPIHRHQSKSTNKPIRTSFGLHSPEGNALPDSREKNLKEYLRQLREKTNRAQEIDLTSKSVMSSPTEGDEPVDNDLEIIDLTLIPPPQTPDELDAVSQVPHILPAVPSSFADDNKDKAKLETSVENSLPPPLPATAFEEFLATVAIPPPAVKVDPAVELTPEEILSYIIPPPPLSNSSTLDRDDTSYVNQRQIKQDMKQKEEEIKLELKKPIYSNGDIIRGTLTVSEIRNMFANKNLSEARNSLLLGEKKSSKSEHVQTKTDSPNSRRKSIIHGSKTANGNTGQVIDYPTVERKGMFSCCSKDNCKSSESEDDKEIGVERTESMPDVCEIRPPPRRKNMESCKPPERPPKSVPILVSIPVPVPRPRSNSFTYPHNDLSAVDISNNHFSTLNNRRLNYKIVCDINEQGNSNIVHGSSGVNPPKLPPRCEANLLSPPPHILLPPKKPPLPPVPSIEFLRTKTIQKFNQTQVKPNEQRLASIGSPHFQRNLNTYKNLENEHGLGSDETNHTQSNGHIRTFSQPQVLNTNAVTLQSRHIRSNSETKNSILKNNEMSTALSLCSPQMNRKFSNRPDILNGAPVSSDARLFSPPLSERKAFVRCDSASPTPRAHTNHVRFKEDVVEARSVPTSPSAKVKLQEMGSNGHVVTIEGLLCKTEVAVDGLLQRLHLAAQKCGHQHAHGGGEDIDETKFQTARSELTSCAVTLVGASRTLVGALGAAGGGAGGGPTAAAALADCLAPLRKLADLAQALGRHTSAPLQTRNLILRVHDVTAAFKELAGADMARAFRERTPLAGQLALRAECLANVLATLLRSLRVFSP